MQQSKPLGAAAAASSTPQVRFDIRWKERTLAAKAEWQRQICRTAEAVLFQEEFFPAY